MMYYVSLNNLYRCMNTEIPETTWIDFQFSALPQTRANRLFFPPNNKLKVGVNILSNRLSFV